MKNNKHLSWSWNCLSASTHVGRKKNEKRFGGFAYGGKICLDHYGNKIESHLRVQVKIEIVLREIRMKRLFAIVFFCGMPAGAAPMTRPGALYQRGTGPPLAVPSFSAERHPELRGVRDDYRKKVTHGNSRCC